MKVILRDAVIGSILAGGLLFGATAQATTFDFYGEDDGGVGSATMTFEPVVGDTLTVTLANTSPITLIGSDDPNAPGITGFGFNVVPDSLTLLSWTLEAYDKDGVLVTIGGTASTGDWVMSESMAGISLDYLPQTDQGVQGALYNPDATDGLAALPNYFTLATLTLNFDDPPAADFTAQWSPFVRMQNVGSDGEGSLRLPGSPNGNGGGGQELPEPATLALFGGGLLGLGWMIRRRNRVDQIG